MPSPQKTIANLEKIERGAFCTDYLVQISGTNGYHISYFSSSLQQLLHEVIVNWKELYFLEIKYLPENTAR